MSLGDGQSLGFPCGFAAVDARLVTPLLRGLSPVELRVYVAATKHCRGRGVLVTTRQLGEMAGTDQARVVPALRQLEALQLLRCHRSPRGTRIDVLSDIPRVLEALQQRRERGPDAPAPRSAARTGQPEPGAARLAKPAAEPAEVGRPAGPADEAEPLAEPPQVAQPQAAASEPTVEAEPTEAARQPDLEAPPAEAAQPPQLPEAGEQPPTLAAPPAGQDAQPASPRPQETAVAEPESEAPTASLGDDPGASLEQASPNYSLDPFLQIPPSLPSPGGGQGAVSGDGGKDADLQQGEPAQTSAHPADASTQPALVAEAEATKAVAQPSPAARPAREALGELVALACLLWPGTSTKAAERWLSQASALVEPAPSQEEMENFLRWAAREESLKTAVVRLAVAVTPDRFVPWMKTHRADQKRRAELAARLAAQAAQRAPRRCESSLEEQEQRRAQARLNQEMASRALAFLDATKGSGHAIRRPSF